MDNINLNNKDIYSYYSYLCSMSNKYQDIYLQENDNEEEQPTLPPVPKGKPSFGNLILLYKIQQLANEKSIAPKDFCKIINKNPNYFYYGLKNHGLSCNKALLKNLLFRLANS